MREVLEKDSLDADALEFLQTPNHLVDRSQDHLAAALADEVIRIALDAHPLHQPPDSISELRAVGGDDAAAHQREDEWVAANFRAGLHDPGPPLAALLE